MTAKPGHHRRRCLVRCCGCAAAAAVAVAVVVIVLWRTVYKVKEPRMTINSFTVGEVNLTAGSSSSVSIVADASVENPNAVAFRFGASTTELLYRGQPVGRARGPAGSAGARGTFRANVTFEVAAGRLLGDPGFLSDVRAGGPLGMETSTRVGGRVRFLGVFGRHVDVVMNCTVSVSVSNQTVLDQHCVQRVWL